MRLCITYGFIPWLLASGSIVAQVTPTEQTATAPALDARDRVYYPGDTESVKPLARKLIGNVWLDQKQIWTSPFHVNRGNAKWWAIFGGATTALVITDRRTSHALENSTGQVRWGNDISKVGTSYTLIPLVAGFYGFGVFEDDPKARETGVLGSEALLDSLIVISVLKPIAGRQRPAASKHRGNFFSGGTSFPSGHAIETWTLASVVAQEYKDTKWVPVVAYSLAGLVSCSRFAAQQHYASDIVAGAAMGWFIGRFVYQTHMNHSIHTHAWMRPSVSPLIQPGSHTYALGLNFTSHPQ